MMRFAAVYLFLFAVSMQAQAQELPPSSGWPLHPVTKLQAVPEPPGGLWPYRRDTLWGYADTTGRVWVRPQFAQEPPRLVSGIQLFTFQKRQAGKMSWGQRYNA